MPRMTQRYRAKLAALRRIESSPKTIDWMSAPDAPVSDWNWRAVPGVRHEMQRTYQPADDVDSAPLAQSRKLAKCPECWALGGHNPGCPAA